MSVLGRIVGFFSNYRNAILLIAMLFLAGMIYLVTNYPRPRTPTRPPYQLDSESQRPFKYDPLSGDRLYLDNSTTSPNRVPDLGHPPPPTHPCGTGDPMSPVGLERRLAMTSFMILSARRSIPAIRTRRSTGSTLECCGGGDAYWQVLIRSKGIRKRALII